jgi:hypothetical protein
VAEALEMLLLERLKGLAAAAFEAAQRAWQRRTEGMNGEHYF